MQDTVLDLCCGTCSWSLPWLARGFRVVGFDIYRHKSVPESIEVRLGDLREVSGIEFRGRAACERIAAEAGAPLLLENVQTAQKWHGSARWHFGPFYLWGEAVPAVMPIFDPRFFKKKESYGSKQKDLRAAIPFDLADHIARVYS